MAFGQPRPRREVVAEPGQRQLPLDDGDDAFNYPWMNAGEMGDWKLTDSQAKKLREYLLRGGFLMLDDFWGVWEGENAFDQLKKVFPDREIQELPLSHPIFHTVFDFKVKPQVPGIYSWQRTGLSYERSDAQNVDYRAIYDDKGRLMVAICHNMDLGDSWEHADNPYYPEKFSAMGIRIAVNYLVYSMTH